jgi:hypothetical protein
MGGVLLGKPEGKTSLERYRRRWEDNIKINLKERRLEVVYRFIWFRTQKNDWFL